MSKRQHVYVPLDVELVAKVGMSVAVASCLGLGLLLVLIWDSSGRGSGYGKLIGTLGMAGQRLGPAMLVFGLAMIIFAGITTWLLSLYASFRIAGPLYRISRDLELQVEPGSIAPVPIRTTDGLQGEWKGFEASVAALRAQHEELRKALGDVEKALGKNTVTAGVAPIELAIAHLKKVEQRVRL